MCLFCVSVLWFGVNGVSRGPDIIVGYQPGAPRPRGRGCRGGAQATRQRLQGRLDHEEWVEGLLRSQGMGCKRDAQATRKGLQ